MTRTLVIATDSETTFECGDMNYVVVNLTDGLLETIRKRVNLAVSVHNQDKALWEMAFWDYSHEFIANLDGIEEDVDEEEYIELTDTKLEFNFSTCTCSFMCIRCSARPEGPPWIGVVFTGMPKHTNATVSSREIPAGVFLNH